MKRTQRSDDEEEIRTLLRTATGTDESIENLIALREQLENEKAALSAKLGRARAQHEAEIKEMKRERIQLEREVTTLHLARETLIRSIKRAIEQHHRLQEYVLKMYEKADSAL